jgi:hypothetical protein
MATSLLALPCKMRAGHAQATVRALPRDELATQAFLRSWRTRGRTICQPTGSILSNYWLTVKDTRGAGLLQWHESTYSCLLNHLDGSIIKVVEGRQLKKTTSRPETTKTHGSAKPEKRRK